MDPLRVAVRVAVAYLFILAGLRLAGKRVVAEATVFDFVLALILGDLFDDLFWAEVPLAGFAVAVGALLAVDIAGELLSTRFPFLSRLYGDAPVRILRRGRRLRKALRRERIDEATLEALLRQGGVAPGDERDVQSAWLDGAGQPAVVRRAGARPADRRTLRRLGRR